MKKTKKGIIWCTISVLLVVCIIVGFSYVRQREIVRNDVFTDEFFENMESIYPFMNEEVKLEGQAADSVASYLKGVLLEPAGGTPISNEQSEVRLGGNQGYCIRYQNGETVHFRVTEAMLTINSKNYYVVDKNGNPAPEFADTIWDLFHPTA